MRGLGGSEGDLSAQSRLHRISLCHFRQEILPTVTEKDCVIVLLSAPELAEMEAADSDMMQLADTVELVRSSGKCCTNLLVASSETLGELAVNYDTLFRIITACADAGGGGARSTPRSPPRSKAGTGMGQQANPSSGGSGQKIAHIHIPKAKGGRGLGGHAGFMDYALKLVTNAITTYAQAAGRGAMYKSLMIAAGMFSLSLSLYCISFYLIHTNTR